jgi:hypothetical protein
VSAMRSAYIAFFQVSVSKITPSQAAARKDNDAEGMVKRSVTARRLAHKKRAGWPSRPPSPLVVPVQCPGGLPLLVGAGPVSSSEEQDRRPTPGPSGNSGRAHARPEGRTASADHPPGQGYNLRSYRSPPPAMPAPPNGREDATKRRGSANGGVSTKRDLRAVSGRSRCGRDLPPADSGSWAPSCTLVQSYHAN